jgi:serine-type D-Ala-D-Ala carboxypeptidase (penicillin-binding protein 5/6)
VSIAAGEQLTERQALQALLLPSANNIAAVLARWHPGSVDRFVARMNAAARSLGMTHTR